MAITPKPAGSVSPPNSPGAQTAGSVAIPNSPTAETAGTVAIPNSPTAETVGAVAIPNSPTAETAGTVAIPNSPTAETVGAVAIPNSPTAETVGAVAIPNSPVAQGVAVALRTLTPLVDMDFAAGCYAQCGVGVAFDDLFTYSRNSSAAFINQRINCGKAEFFLDTDYVGNVTNLLTYSEQFDHANWSKVNSLVSNGFISDDATNGLHTIDSSSVNITSGVSYTGTMTVKAGSTSIVRLDFSGFANWDGSPYVAFDIKTGVFLESGSSEIVGSIESVGDDWFEISITATAAATTTSEFKLVLTDGTTTGVSYIGDGSGVFARKAQLTESAKPLPYVKTISTSVTDTFAESLRMEYNPVTGEALGALIEGASTNLALRSEEFDNASWTKSNSTITQNNITSPDGTTSADKLEAASTATIQPYMNQTIAVTVATDHTFSIYVKASEARYIQMLFGAGEVANDPRANFDLTDGTLGTVDADITASIKNTGGGWFRISMTALSASTSMRPRVVLIKSATDTRAQSNAWTIGDGAHVWGAQLEALPFASSYIRTEGSTVSRVADGLSVAGHLMPYKNTAYSINCNYTLKGVFDFGSGTNQHIYRFDGEVNRLMRAMDNGSGRPLVINGSTSLDYPTALVAGESYSSTAVISKLQSEAYLDGSSVAVGAVTAISGSVTSLNIGSGASLTQSLFGNIKQLAVYDVALTAAEVSKL